MICWQSNHTENKDIVPKLKIVTDLKEMTSTKLKNNIFTRNDTIVALISIHCNFQMVWWFMVFYPLSTIFQLIVTRSRRGRDCVVVGFTTSCAITAYHHTSFEFEPRSWRGVLDTTLCDKVCRWLATGRFFSLGTPVAST
jgi:hypothetical protein